MVWFDDAVPVISLVAENLNKSFSAGPPLFSGLDLRLERGLVAVTGRNGSGKTTLLKVLAGLLRPSGGRVGVECDGVRLPADERRRAVGWAGPDLALYGELTPEENLRFFRRAAGLPIAHEEALRRLGDAGLGSEAIGGMRRVDELSTGMRQRLRLAFALLFDPPILLLDEPSASLDAEGRDLVREVVRRARESGAVLVASNDDRDLERPERVIELGRVR
jgi:heme exporter protein A